MATALIDSVLHWRRKLEKNPDDDYILNVIRKLSKVPITLEILEATHIGKTIRKLSKRDDIVGEKAKTVLNKWREVFASQGSVKNQKLPCDSKKENVNKESKPSHKHTSHEKTIHPQKQTSRNHEYKYKNSFSSNLSEQSSKKYVNGNCKANYSTEPSYPQNKYDVKERNSNYMDYDPHSESSEGYNPECPELFPSDKPMKIKKPVLTETYEPSSVKRKFTDEREQKEEKSHEKKFKSNSHSNSDNVTESKKSSEKKDKHSSNKEKSKNYSHSPYQKKESKKEKSNSESAKNHELVSCTKKTKGKESSEIDRTKSKKSKLKILSSEEFTSLEVSFEDCLGLNDIVSLKKSSKSLSSKKPSSSIPSKEKPTEKNKDLSKIASKDKKVKDLSSNIKKEKVPKESTSSVHKSKVSKDSSHSNEPVSFIVPKPTSKLDVADITSTLPEIQPNYRPLPRSPEFYAPKKKEVLSNEEAIKFTSSRHERTAVYSGRKSNSYTEAPSLREVCTKVLIENIDAIECVGNASYDMMKPILERCNPVQLYNIENYNHKFIEDTNELWEAHCKRDYKLMSPMEHETWRELYWRAHDEHEKKLKRVTANISSKLMANVTPVRQVKLAYVDSKACYVKPPRDIAKKQLKHGTAAPVNHATKNTSPSKTPKRPPSSATSSAGTSSNSSSAFKKPKRAPLMAKILKSLKVSHRK